MTDARAEDEIGFDTRHGIWRQWKSPKGGNEMTNIKTSFKLEGTTYTETKTGYCYKTTGKQDKKGNDITIRIPRHVFESKFEEFIETPSGFESKDLKLGKTKKSKKRKPRKSKDIAFEHKINGETVLTLTSKQVDFIEHLPDTCYWENGLESSVWCDCLCDEIGGQFENKPMTVGAMISTLREKGVIEVLCETSRQGKPKYFVLTELGKEIATGRGLC